MNAKGTLMLVTSIALFAYAAQGMADSKKPGKAYKIPPGKTAQTPPGLAKKPGGMPPGQYKKIYRKGDLLPRDLVWITYYDNWRLPPLAPVQGYARYEYEIYLVARDTATVIEAIGIVSDLLR